MPTTEVVEVEVLIVVLQHEELLEMVEVMVETAESNEEMELLAEVEVEVEVATGHLDAGQFEEYSYKELQKLAKDMGLSAGGTRDELIARITAEEVQYPVEDDVRQDHHNGVQGKGLCLCGADIECSEHGGDECEHHSWKTPSDIAQGRLIDGGGRYHQLHQIWREELGQDYDDPCQCEDEVQSVPEQLACILEELISFDFYYRAYQAAKKGESNRKAVFVPWFMIERYTKPVEDKERFAEWLLSCKDNPNPPEGCLDAGEYYWHLWELGASFEAINWYIEKRKDYMEHGDMAAEFPSDDIEAFKHSGNMVFNVSHVDSLAKKCKDPAFVGEVQGDSIMGKDALKNLRFISDSKGILKVWSLPAQTKEKYAGRYIVAVDIGGRSKTADFSDIIVLDRYWMMFGGVPEVVAEWHGHIDHDLLAWKAAQIAAFYDNALLVIESNTIESKDNDTDGDQSALIFNRISDVYPNLYMRRAPEEKVEQGVVGMYGFHTNRRTKPIIISNLVSILRDNGYVERNIEAIAEYSVYEKKQNGSYGATDGHHDDYVMARAIALYICYCEMEIPSVIKSMDPIKRKERIATEASII